VPELTLRRAALLSAICYLLLSAETGFSLYRQIAAIVPSLLRFGLDSSTASLYLSALGIFATLVLSLLFAGFFATVYRARGPLDARRSAHRRARARRRAGPGRVAPGADLPNLLRHSRQPRLSAGFDPAHPGDPP
jgi:hypothetical protein